MRDEAPATHADVTGRVPRRLCRRAPGMELGSDEGGGCSPAGWASGGEVRAGARHHESHPFTSRYVRS